jgi:signal transduction histidine kinase
MHVIIHTCRWLPCIILSPVELIVQLIKQLHLPAQLWRPDGTVAATNSRFNELLGLAAYFDWDRNQAQFRHDPQLTGSGTDVLINRVFQGVPVEIHSLKYNPALNPHNENYTGGTLQLTVTLRPLFEGEQLVCVVCFISEMATNELRYEQELMRSQKMESVETLASGVAHEFNNLFTGIKGMTDLIKGEVDQMSETYEFADSIQQSISRGAELIQQLSSFAREVPYTFRQRKIADYIEHVLPLLKLHVQRRITIQTKVNCKSSALLDVNKMDQALANVIANSRDAMGGQGRILISVCNVDEALMEECRLPVGAEWVRLAIGDSGPGIPEELRGRVLEPFFSTKERGKATGLGLSVTNRIIMSHNGLIQIGTSAELGGADIRIYLPIARERS